MRGERPDIANEKDDSLSSIETLPRHQLDDFARRHSIEPTDFRRCDENSRHVVYQAAVEAEQLERSYMDGGALMLALIRSDQPSIWQEYSVTCQEAQTRIEELYQEGQDGRILAAPVSDILKQVNDRTPYQPRPEDVLLGLHLADSANSYRVFGRLFSTGDSEEIIGRILELQNPRANAETLPRACGSAALQMRNVATEASRV